MLEAKEQGLKIPNTFITGSKEKLINFFDVHNAKNGIVSKRILDSYLYQDETFLYNFNLTFQITPEILSKTPDEFAISFFQERVIPDFEIRSIYIDGCFFSAAIHNFNNDIDCRSSFIKMENLRIIPFKLPLDIENKLEKVFKKFNLNYGSADILFCNDDYFFLEINPAGQISFINNACNYYIETKLAKILKNGI